MSPSSGSKTRYVADWDPLRIKLCGCRQELGEDGHIHHHNQTLWLQTGAGRRRPYSSPQPNSVAADKSWEKTATVIMRTQFNGCRKSWEKTASHHQSPTLWLQTRAGRRRPQSLPEPNSVAADRSWEKTALFITTTQLCGCRQELGEDSHSHHHNQTLWLQTRAGRRRPLSSREPNSMAADKS